MRISKLILINWKNFKETEIVKQWRGQGIKYQERDFSDGTLRLIGLLWALQDGTKPILLEEPELSLHSSIIRQLPDIIYQLQKKKTVKRQVILTTHSFEILENKGIAGKCGISYIKNNMRTFNETSKSLPHIVVTDLDRKPCAPQLIREWITFEVHNNMLFRIAERENIAAFMSMPVNKIPVNTQEITDSKQFIINLARKSRKKIIKDFIPQRKSKTMH
ncbi:hypothetical protein FACS189413_10490 [Bacteroidia bacterium]|nr:hypothetical protein FACS189413_10490 [Bacteroidia bacterium]